MAWSLDWEEGAFRAVRALIGRLRPRSDTVSVGSVAHLADLEGELTALAQFIAGRPVRVRAAETVGGVGSGALLLPTRISLAEDEAGNRDIYVLRTVIGATLMRNENRPPAALSRASDLIDVLLRIHGCVSGLARELPGFARLCANAVPLELAARPDLVGLSPAAAGIERLRRALLTDETAGVDRAREQWGARPLPRDLPPGLVIWGEGLSSGDARAAADVAEELGLLETPDGTEVSAPPVDHVSRTLLERVEEVEPVPLHTFEKTETLDNYKGGSRTLDGDDELEDHLEALDELQIREVIRGGRETHSVYRTDIDLGGEIPDVTAIRPDEPGISYPEWNTATGSYREDWVTVYTTRVRGRDRRATAAILREHRGLIERLENRLSAHRFRNLRLDRQAWGDEIDLTALVDARALLASGRDPGERLYAQRRKLCPGAAITLLLDISLSSDSWLAGRRILDVTREAVLILGEVVDRLGDALRILCYASHTRNHCRIFEVVDWQEAWPEARDRIVTLEPQGYTRIGPALRHACADLSRAPAERGAVILISDGKPTDYDRYEGRYGIEDVRMAVREAARKGIHTYALALDHRARASLPAMFGVGGWQIVRRIGDLPDAVVRAYGRLSTR